MASSMALFLIPNERHHTFHNVRAPRLRSRTFAAALGIVSQTSSTSDPLGQSSMRMYALPAVFTRG